MINYLISSPLGVVSVYFEANVTSGRAQGFNASFWVKRCGNGSSGEGTAVSPECQAGAQCINGLCECPHGFGGPQCDRPVCPGNCGAEESRGTCNMVCNTPTVASCIAQEHKMCTKVHLRHVPQFSTYMFAYTFTDPWPVCVYRRLGWIRLFFYLRLGQSGLGNVAWYSALCG